ncbi:MAG: YbhN family protein [Gammaproteobacteria bacterium]
MIIVAISLYLISVIFLGWESSISVIKKISVSGWLGLVACSFTSYILRYCRWAYFVNKLGFNIPHLQHFLYYLSGFALTISPAKIGETIRSLYLYQHGINYTKSISAFIIERLLDLAIVTVLSSLLLYQHDDYAVFISLLLTTILLIIFTLRIKYLQTFLLKYNNNFKSARLNKIIESINNLLAHTQILLQPQPLSIGLIIGFFAWSIQGAAFYILLQQLGFEIPFYTAISIYSIALISGALSFIPGGIGSTEIVMGVFLYYFGAPKEIVIMAPIIIRITSLWFAVLVGLISTIIITKRVNFIEN